jgi:hypothetical protein
MDAEMKVTDAAKMAGIEAFNAEIERQLTATKRTGPAIEKAIQAALAAMLEPVGCVSDAAMERLRAVPDTWDDIFTLDGDTSDMTTLYRIKPE